MTWVMLPTVIQFEVPHGLVVPGYRQYWYPVAFALAPQRKTRLATGCGSVSVLAGAILPKAPNPGWVLKRHQVPASASVVLLEASIARTCQ